MLGGWLLIVVNGMPEALQAYRPPTVVRAENHSCLRARDQLWLSLHCACVVSLCCACVLACWALSA